MWTRRLWCGSDEVGVWVMCLSLAVEIFVFVFCEMGGMTEMTHSRVYERECFVGLARRRNCIIVCSSIGSTYRSLGHRSLLPNTRQEWHQDPHTTDPTPSHFLFDQTKSISKSTLYLLPTALISIQSLTKTTSSIWDE